MRIMFIGDVVGSLGRETITTYLPKLEKISSASDHREWRECCRWSRNYGENI